MFVQPWVRNSRLVMWRAVFVGVLFTAGTCTGCSRDQVDRVQVFPAAGQVLWDNKPLAGALVVLHPNNVATDKALPSRAQTNGEGRFELTTYEAGDGAPIGEYTVTVEYYPLQKNGDSFLAGANALPPKYSKPDSSDLRVRITDKPNELPPLVLRR